MRVKGIEVVYYRRKGMEHSRFDGREGVLVPGFHRSTTGTERRDRFLDLRLSLGE